MSLPTTTDFTPKKFWERPEGTTGMITLALLGVGGLFLANALLPTILSVLSMAITAVGQTIVLGALCTALAAFLFLVTNSKVQTLVSFMFKTAMRKITGAFVEIDPIGIMRVYIADLAKSLGMIDKGISELNGQMTICQRKIDSNATKHTEAMTIADQAYKQGANATFQVNARQAGRLEKSNVTLSQLLETMKLHKQALKKYREVSYTILEDMKNEVDVRAEERDLINTSYGVLKSVKRIMNGDPDKRELYDMAMEYQVADYGMKLGEITDFIETSASFVQGLDIQNGIYEAEALKRIQEWETKADSILLGDSKRQMIEGANVNRVPMQLQQNTDIEADYLKLMR